MAHCAGEEGYSSYIACYKSYSSGHQVSLLDLTVVMQICGNLICTSSVPIYIQDYTLALRSLHVQQSFLAPPLQGRQHMILLCQLNKPSLLHDFAIMQSCRHTNHKLAFQLLHTTMQGWVPHVLLDRRISAANGSVQDEAQAAQQQPQARQSGGYGLLDSDSEDEHLDEPAQPAEPVQEVIRSAHAHTE